MLSKILTIKLLLVSLLVIDILRSMLLTFKDTKNGIKILFINAIFLEDVGDQCSPQLPFFYLYYLHEEYCPNLYCSYHNVAVPFGLHQVYV